MKQIIIFLLIVIVGLIGWSQYKKYKRFSLSEYQYKIPDEIENTSDKSLLLDYLEAVESVNGYVITQWSAHGIDIRNPKKDNDRTRAAVSEYGKRLANVKFYEQQLLNPETKTDPLVISEEQRKKELIRSQFFSNTAANSFRIGDQNALVFEIQRILIEEGYPIKHDGLFRAETFNALKSFEEKNGLFPDGKLDALTLEYLLK